jgi:DNA invertase Pin-like site-specific DNA recombinase
MVAAHKNGQRVGYIRVSSVDQNTERQLDGVPVDEVFTDKASGKDTQRPQLQAALKHLRKGDVLVVHSIDRLARNLADLLRIVTDLNSRGVAVEFCKEHLEFAGDASPMSHLMLSIIGACAQFERSMIRERQKEGIELAKGRGVYVGRKAILKPAQVQELRKRVAAGEDKATVAKAFGISRASVYNYVKEAAAGA